MRVSVSVALLLGLSACIGSPPPTGPDADAAAQGPWAAAVSFPDPLHDAHEYGARQAIGGQTCPTACPDETVPAGAEAPYFDITSVDFLEENEHDIVLGLSIANIKDGFPDLDATELGHRMASYTACYAPPQPAGSRCASLDVATMGNVLEASAAFTINHSPGCNEWATCAWDIPYEIIPGTPTQIRFIVPKQYALWDGVPPTITSMSGSTFWTAVNPVSPEWHTALSINAATNFHRHVGAAAVYDEPDSVGAVAAKITFNPDTEPIAPLPNPLLSYSPGNNLGYRSVFDKPELDLLAIDLSEDATDLITTFTVASMPTLPSFDFLFIVEIGVAGKEVWEVGYIKEPENGAYGYAGHCISYECGGDLGGDHADHPMDEQFSDVVPAEIDFGSPARITVRTPLALFPSLVASDTTNLVLATSMYDDASVWSGEYGDNPRWDWHKMSFIDYQWGGMPHTFAYGNAADETHHH